MNLVTRTTAREYHDDTKKWLKLKARADRWPQLAYTDGTDICIENVLATCFGGQHDKGDDGRTSSGVLTSVPGGIAGCALPLPLVRACRGTPLPVLPWRFPVIVQAKGFEITIPLIDEGPAGGLKSAAFIDLTEQAVSSLFPFLETATGLANWWSGRVDVFLKGGAHYLADYFPWGCEDDADYRKTLDALIGSSVMGKNLS